jgi:hypothetical protein
MKRTFTLAFFCLVFALSAQTTHSILIGQADYESAVYHLETNRVYAVVGDVSRRDNANCLLAIDPAVSRVSKKYWVGYKPSLIRLSRDEKYLFFVTLGPARLRRFNIKTQKVDWSIPIPSASNYEELLQVPGRTERWVLALHSTKAHSLCIIDPSKNTINQYNTDEKVWGFDFQNDTTLLSGHESYMQHFSIRTDSLKPLNKLRQISPAVSAFGFFIGSRLFYYNKEIFRVEKDSFEREDSFDLERYDFFMKDPQNGDLITIERINDIKAKFYRFSAKELRLVDTFRVEFPLNIKAFEAPFSVFDPRLVITGPNRFFFRSSAYVNVAWRCKSELERPDLKGFRDTSFCQGDSLLLRSSQLGRKVSWNNGAEGLSLYAKTSGFYAFRLTDESGCQTAYSDSVKVNVLPGSIEEIRIGSSAPYEDDNRIAICKGATVELSADPTVSYESKFRWFNGSVEPRIMVGPGVYWAVGISEDGCPGKKTYFEVRTNGDTIPPKPKVRVLGNNDALIYCPNEPVILETNAQFGFIYEWGQSVTFQNRIQFLQNSLNEPTFYPYTVRMGKHPGCMSAFSDTINILHNPIPVAPKIRHESGRVISNQQGPHQWFLNGIRLNNTNDNSIPVQGAGFYTAKSTGNPCGESPMSEPVGVSAKFAVSLAESNTRELKIQPNPVYDEIRVRLDQPSELNTRAQVISMDGKLMMEQRISPDSDNHIRFALSNLPKGIYLLRVLVEDRQYVGRFVKL